MSNIHLSSLEWNFIFISQSCTHMKYLLNKNPLYLFQIIRGYNGTVWILVVSNLCTYLAIVWCSICAINIWNSFSVAFNFLDNDYNIPTIKNVHNFSYQKGKRLFVDYVGYNFLNEAVGAKGYLSFHLYRKCFVLKVWYTHCQNWIYFTERARPRESEVHDGSCYSQEEAGENGGQTGKKSHWLTSTYRNDSKFLDRQVLRVYTVCLFNFIFLVHLSHLSPFNLDSCAGTTDDFASILFQLALSSAVLRESPNPIPVHSLMLSSHLFFCLPLLLYCQLYFLCSKFKWSILHRQ